MPCEDKCRDAGKASTSQAMAKPACKVPEARERHGRDSPSAAEGISKIVRQ